MSTLELSAWLRLHRPRSLTTSTLSFSSDKSRAVVLATFPLMTVVPRFSFSFFLTDILHKLLGVFSLRSGKTLTAIFTHELFSFIIFPVCLQTTSYHESFLLPSCWHPFHPHPSDA